MHSLKLCLLLPKHSPLVYTNIEMVGRRSAYAVEIRSYVLFNYGCILGIGYKDICDEMYPVYGHNEMSFSIVSCWFKKFKCG